MAEFKWYGVSPDAPPPLQFILRMLLERTTADQLRVVQQRFRRECSELVLAIINEFMDMWAEGLQADDPTMVFLAQTAIATFANVDPTESDECEYLVEGSAIVHQAALSYCLTDETFTLIKLSTVEEFADSYLAQRIKPIVMKANAMNNRMRDRLLADLNFEDVGELRDRWQEELRKGRMS